MKKDMVISVRCYSTDLAVLVKYAESKGIEIKSISQVVGSLIEEIANKVGTTTTTEEASRYLRKKFGNVGRSKNQRSMFENLLDEELTTNSTEDVEDVVKNAISKRRKF